MIESNFRSELTWPNFKLLLRSMAVGMLFFLFFWGLAKRAEPPEGSIFERLPSIRGIYKCCEAGGRYSESWVGPISVNCKPIGYYKFLGTGRNDCGRKAELNGKTVEVVRVITPSFGGDYPLVSLISENGHKFYELSDDRLRDLWIWSARSQSITIAFILGIFFHAAQLILMNQKNRKGVNK